MSANATPIHLKVTCVSSSAPAFYGGRNEKKREHDETEVVVFTRIVVPLFHPQHGMRLAVDGMTFTLQGRAALEDVEIHFSAEIEKPRHDSRITYIRKWRKETYKALLAAGWQRSVTKETVRQ